MAEEASKKEQSPTEISTEKLSGQEFIERLERDINKAEWAPQLSLRLSEITHAELDERSSIENNLDLYSKLAQKASWLSVTEGKKSDRVDPYAATSTPAVRMSSCVQIATEANRRIHEYMRSKPADKTSE